MVLSLLRSTYSSIMSSQSTTQSTTQSIPSSSFSVCAPSALSGKMSRYGMSESGWKWEVNHDGVIWSWYHPTPFMVSSSSLDKVQDKVPSQTQTQTQDKVPSQVQDKVQTQSKQSLVDYWYVVNDGVVVPTVNDW